ncbi:MAG: aspartyl protease family protein [Candidatus Limnocylindria bacterium]
MAEGRIWMGVTQVKGVVTGPTGVQTELELLVDSGANYSLLPTDVWRRLALVPTRTERFALADGTVIQRKMSECRIALPSMGETATPVILGEPGDVALLGTVTLEELGLVLNPLDRTVRKMKMLLLRVG